MHDDAAQPCPSLTLEQLHAYKLATAIRIIGSKAPDEDLKDAFVRFQQDVVLERRNVPLLPRQAEATAALEQEKQKLRQAEAIRQQQAIELRVLKVKLEATQAQLEGLRFVQAAEEHLASTPTAAHSAKQKGKSDKSDESATAPACPAVAETSTDTISKEPTKGKSATARPNARKKKVVEPPDPIAVYEKLSKEAEILIASSQAKTPFSTLCSLRELQVLCNSAGKAADSEPKRDIATTQRALLAILQNMRTELLKLTQMNKNTASRTTSAGDRIAVHHKVLVYTVMLAVQVLQTFNNKKHAAALAAASSALLGELSMLVGQLVLVVYPISLQTCDFSDPSEIIKDVATADDDAPLQLSEIQTALLEFLATVFLLADAVNASLPPVPRDSGYATLPMMQCRIAGLREIKRLAELGLCAISKRDSFAADQLASEEQARSSTKTPGDTIMTTMTTMARKKKKPTQAQARAAAKLADDKLANEKIIVATRQSVHCLLSAIRASMEITATTFNAGQSTNLISKIERAELLACLSWFMGSLPATEHGGKPNKQEEELGGKSKVLVELLGGKLYTDLIACVEEMMLEHGYEAVEEMMARLMA